MKMDAPRPDLSDPEVLLSLPPRGAPYYSILRYCRHLGLHKTAAGTGYWVARIRRKDGGYTQHRLALALFAGTLVNRYEAAVALAEDWFERPDISKQASEAYPVGSRRSLGLCPIGDRYTVGHALADYIDWKRLAATASTFEVLVSLVNHHLVPHVAHIVLEEFNGTHFHDLAMRVIETAPMPTRKP